MIHKTTNNIKPYNFILILSIFIFFTNCNKEKRGEIVSEITPCISGFFPSHEYSLSMQISENNSIVFEVDSISTFEGSFPDLNTDDCLLHKVQINKLKSKNENYNISFIYPYANFNKSFLITIKNNVNDTSQKFTIKIDENCNTLNNSLNELLDETFYESISINNYEYKNVYKIARNFLEVDHISIDDGQFLYLYF